MSSFHTRVRDSAVVANLKQANTKLDALSTRKWEHQSRIDLIQMLRSVGTTTLARLYIRRDLVSQITLNNLEVPSSNFLYYIERIGETSIDDESYESDAIHAADDVLANAASLPALHIRTTKGVFERASEQFDREVQSSMAELSARFDEVRSEVTGLSNHIGEASAQFVGQVADLETRLRNGIDRAESQAASLLDDTRESADSLLAQVRGSNETLEREITSIQEVFRDSQKDRDRDFEDSQVARVKSFHEWLDPAVSEVEKLRNQARSMLEEVAGAGTAEHYAKQRDMQDKAANRWRWIGVGALVVLVVATGVIFTLEAQSAGQDFSVGWLVARSGFAIAIGVFAAYALRQSGHHRRREEDMARVANELQLLWPFMNRLPDEDRQDLLRDITPLYFKGGISARNDGDSADSSGSLDAGISGPRDQLTGD